MVDPSTIRATHVITMLSEMIPPKTSQAKFLSLAESPSLDGNFAQQLPTMHQQVRISTESTAADAGGSLPCGRQAGVHGTICILSRVFFLKASFRSRSDWSGDISRILILGLRCRLKSHGSPGIL
jgi:hypothetical protein